MNKVDELLIKYKFTNKPIEDNCIKDEAFNLDRRINRRYMEIEDKLNTETKKEIELINEILKMLQQDIFERLNTGVTVSQDYQVGKSYDELLNIKININKTIKKQEGKESKVLSHIESAFEKKEFEEIKHNFYSSEFLKHITIQ